MVLNCSLILAVTKRLVVTSNFVGFKVPCKSSSLLNNIKVSQHMLIIVISIILVPNLYFPDLVYLPFLSTITTPTCISCCSINSSTRDLYQANLDMPLDLTLYLVTDSTPNVLGNGDLLHVVEEAVKGGVSIVQYRDKHAETGELISTAAKLHEVTKRSAVPLLINDRVDVALAVGAEGVHLGQDDMSIATARKILGKDAIIGITATSIGEAQAAHKGGADYLGIGTVFVA